MAYGGLPVAFDAKKLPDYLAGVFIVLAVLVLAFSFENFGGTIPGHFLGVSGTALMFAALIYSFRKRILKKKGRQNPLVTHIYFGLIGSSFVVVHSGHKHANIIGILIYTAMLLVVLSGIIGKMLYARVVLSLRGLQLDLEMLSKSFREQKKTGCAGMDACLLLFERDDWLPWAGKADGGAPGPAISDIQPARILRLLDLVEAMAEKEWAIQIFSRTQRYFSFWSKIHVLATYFLFSMVAVHVLTTLYYGLRWLP